MLDRHAAHGTGGRPGLLEVFGAILAAALVNTAYSARSGFNSVVQ